ncbi:MAG: DMT family transporter [Deltaproteobacteria bacterium]|nr:DMT family transporter [Deltaproteobacteria bacterium]
MDVGGLSQHVVGGSFALSAAALWAGASILWKRLGEDVPSAGMNLGKGLVALALLAVMLIAAGPMELGLHAWLVLGASGVVGVALGDTAYFLALVRLGPRRILVLTTLTPLLASFMAIALLGERPSFQWGVGTLLCLGGVAWVMRERLPDGADRGRWRSGIAIGIGAALCEATGTLLTKVGLGGTPEYAWREATFIRMLFAVTALSAYAAARGKIGDWLGPFRRGRRLLVLVAASFIGTFLAILFATASLWYTHVALAAVLKSMSPIFILPLARLFMKERITVPAVLGAVLAVAGAALVMTAF